MKRFLAFSLAAVFSFAAADQIFAQDSAVPKQITGGVLNSKATSLPRPEYPAEARAAKLSGTVAVAVVIDEAGVVISAKADTGTKMPEHADQDPDRTEVRAVDSLLREAAEKAAMEARFSPTLLSGTPVKVSGYIVYNFSADGENRISGGVLNGKALSLPKPPYPAAARAVRAEGSVTVQLTVDENGDVISAQAVSGHPLLRTAAVEAARGAKFSPTLLEGQPVKITGVIVYNFVAPDSDPM